MRLTQAWIIARKDMLVMTKRKSLRFGTFIIPLMLGIGLPLLVDFLIVKRNYPISKVADILGAFGFLFVIIAVFIPLYLSSYSIVGEKVENTLEPLLSTPTEDKEILIGKYMGALIPSLIRIYAGMIVLMILSDILLTKSLGYLFFPNYSMSIVALIAVPLAAFYAVSFSILISSKVDSTQGSYQLGALSILPLYIIYVMGEVGVISLSSVDVTLVISLSFLIVSLITYVISEKTFRRQTILTTWK